MAAASANPGTSWRCAAGVGRLLATSYDIWNNGTEKVLGVGADWAERHPATLRALIAALLEASAWIDRLENRLETARLLTREDYVPAPLEAIAYPLLDLVQSAPDEAPRHLPDAHVFHRYAANFPSVGHALWYGQQMVAAGQLDRPLDLATARAVYRPDLYRAAAARRSGSPAPTRAAARGSPREPLASGDQLRADRHGPRPLPRRRTVRPALG